MTNSQQRIQQSLKRRYRAENRFRWYGRFAILFAITFLLVLFTDIVTKGIGAFRATEIKVTVTYDLPLIGIDDFNDISQRQMADWDKLVKLALYEQFPDVTKRRHKKALYGMVSSASGYDIRDRLLDQPALVGQTESRWILADDDVDSYLKGLRDGISEVTYLTAEQQLWVQEMVAQENIRLTFNTQFFSGGDSRDPEQAGIRGAVMGSFYTLIVTLLLSFPIGVGAAIYLECFAPKNRLTEIIEVNINNLAAVPSIIFGLLGLAIFINLFHLPRSAPLVGGLVLSLMTLPTIIIASRAAIKAVPPSIQEAAIGMGASKQQVVWHHVLPLALPGMLTGAIIGMAQALGETAPLLMIGMVAFIVDVPGGFTEAATALPVQIFLWADSPERAFVEKTSAAIMVLLGFLILMNTTAVYLRKRLKRTWS